LLSALFSTTTLSCAFRQEQHHFHCKISILQAIFAKVHLLLQLFALLSVSGPQTLPPRPDPLFCRFSIIATSSRTGSAFMAHRMRIFGGSAGSYSRPDRG
jgi:hypothetical protein